MTRVVVADTGCANLASVQFALQRLGASVEVSDDAQVLLRAPRVVIPGVGTAQAAMRSLVERGLDKVLPQLKQPTLGLCLGMQLLTERSYESSGEPVDCLKIIPGEVRRMQAKLRLPHMGWNQVVPLEGDPLFAGIEAGAFFYFVHSYSVAPQSYTNATCDYGGDFSASLRRDNFFGVQFHPERSSTAGAELLKNFLALS